jgi:hypothetical protein
MGLGKPLLDMRPAGFFVLVFFTQRFPAWNMTAQNGAGDR